MIFSFFSSYFYVPLGCDYSLIELNSASISGKTNLVVCELLPLNHQLMKLIGYTKWNICSVMIFNTTVL